MKTGPLLNLVLLVLLAFVLGVGSFFSVPKESFGEETAWDFAGQFTWDTAVETSEIQSARLNGRDSVSLLPGTSATLAWDEARKHGNVELSEGAVVFSTFADDFSVSVATPFARVDSQTSSAYVVLDSASESLTVYALTHPSLVTFTDEQGETLHALLVPSAHKMKIPASKVSKTLSRLRLTKLSKEFPVFSFEEDELSPEVSELLKDSEEVYAKSALTFVNQIQEESNLGPPLTGLGGALNRVYLVTRDFLTFLPTAEVELQEKESEKALRYALSNFLYGDSPSGITWLSQWQNSGPSLKEVSQLLNALFFALPGDALYPVKAAAAEILYSEEESLKILRRQFQEIESLLQAGFQVEAQSAYQNYQEKFQTALERGDFDNPDILPDISREYGLVELLLRSHSIFYTVDSIPLMADLEEKILALAGSDQDLDEERQAFVQSKIRFLTNLFNFVVDQRISVETASDLAEELLSQAESYLNSITSEVAVQAYFESLLEDFALSLEFMNSPEFYSYDSFEEGLEAYRLKQEALEDLNAYLQNLRSGEEEEASVTLEQAIEEVEEALHLNGVQYSEVRSLGDSAHRLFEIVGARSAGYAFQANYDRETQILYDVTVGELRFSTGLTLENAKDVIEEAMGSTPALEEGEETLTQAEGPSLTESVALVRVETRLMEAGLDSADFTITVVDLDENVFTIEGKFLEGEILMSGNYDLDTNLVTEIIWEYQGEITTAKDTDLSELEALFSCDTVERLC